MRDISRLCRRLSRRLGLYFVVTKFPGYFVVHSYDPVTQGSVSLARFRRVSDVRRFLLDFFNR